MGDLEPLAHGQVDNFGVADRLGRELEENFRRRGHLTGQLLMTTLTESDYAPEETGGHPPVGTDGGALVAQAAGILKEAVDLKGREIRPLRLATYQTGYRDMLNGLQPGPRTGKRERGAYEEAVMDSIEELDLGLDSIGKVFGLIKGAPKRLKGLRVDDYDVHGNNRMLRLVTVQGRELHLERQQREGILSTTYSYHLPTSGDALKWRRGGHAPTSSTIAALNKRIADLTIGHTRRWKD